MAFSLPMPAMPVVTEQINQIEFLPVAPTTEMTRIYWRTYDGQLQFRVWSITNGRWITDWTNANLLPIDKKV
jgi:hypothetical protein